MLEWRFDELKDLDKKHKKLLTMHKGLHSKNDADRLYVSREEGERGLVSCENTLRSEENNLGWCLKNSNCFKKCSASGFWSSKRVSQRMPLKNRWMRKG